MNFYSETSLKFSTVATINDSNIKVWGPVLLEYCGIYWLNKLYPILQTILSGSFSLVKITEIFIQISLRFVQYGQFDNKSALVQAMAWHQTGAKTLPEPMMTQSSD